MSDDVIDDEAPDAPETQPQAAAAAGNQTIVYILAGVVAVLVIAIGVLMYNKSTAVPPVSPVAGTGTGVPAATGQDVVAFDPANAPKVPAGQTPVEYVTSYYEAVQAGDFAGAFALLPLDQQQKYGDSAAFGDQLSGYGISGYEVEEPQESEGQVDIVAWQQTPQGAFGYKWTLVKDGESWLVQTRVQAGMK